MTGRLSTILLIGLTAGCAARQPEVTAPLPPLTAASTYDAGAPQGVRDAYRLLPGDVLRVKFLFHPELDVKVPVRPDGTIALLDFGVVEAEGLTAEEVARQVEEAASEELRDPVVTVILSEIGPHKVYVGGEVRHPGFVLYRPGMTPLEAILDRGGFTDVARIDSVLKVATYRRAAPEPTRLDFSRTLMDGSPEISELEVYDVLFVPRTFVGDANRFVRLYLRNMMPIPFRTGVAFAPQEE